MRAAIEYAQARNVVVVAPVSTATGTTATNVASYPAAYPGVIAVSAVDASGTPAAGGKEGVRVDLAAPGAGLISIGPRGRGDIGGDGAALATAFVAGTAALVRSYYPQLSAAEVVHRLEVTADRPGVTLPDPQVGYGTVDPVYRDHDRAARGVRRAAAEGPGPAADPAARGEATRHLAGHRRDRHLRRGHRRAADRRGRRAHPPARPAAQLAASAR